MRRAARAIDGGRRHRGGPGLPPAVHRSAGAGPRRTLGALLVPVLVAGPISAVALVSAVLPGPRAAAAAPSGHFVPAALPSLNAPIVAAAATTDSGGAWEAAADGGVFAVGDAVFAGSMGGKPLDAPIVGFSPDPATGGYWEAAADGGVFAFDAPFSGSMGGKPLDAPVVGMAADPTGQGYWLVAADGGVFAFGDAAFSGSMGGAPLDRPIEAMATDASTGGYWLVASDGGVFAFDAPFDGSLGGTALASPVHALYAEDAGAAYVLCTGAGLCAGGWPGHPPALPVTGDPLLPPDNPPDNIAPVPPFTVPCFAGTPPACSAEAVAATDAARATAEQLPPMRLPGDFTSLTADEQLFVLTDVERVSRGESPVYGLYAVLDATAQGAAAAGEDPTFADIGPTATVTAAFGNWSSYTSPLTSNYAWMYLDGWGGGTGTPNLDCHSPTTAGCWGHRDDILNRGTTTGTAVEAMGAGAVDGTSYTEEYVAYAGLTALTADLGAPLYTWADAVAAGAGV